MHSVATGSGSTDFVFDGSLSSRGDTLLDDNNDDEAALGWALSNERWDRPEKRRPNSSTLAFSLFVGCCRDGMRAALFRVVLRLPKGPLSSDDDDGCLREARGSLERTNRR